MTACLRAVIVVDCPQPRYPSPRQSPKHPVPVHLLDSTQAGPFGENVYPITGIRRRGPMS